MPEGDADNIARSEEGWTWTAGREVELDLPASIHDLLQARLDSLPPGFHELTLGKKRNARQVALDTTAAPGLYLFVHSDRNVGALAVVAGEEDGATDAKQPERIIVREVALLDAQKRAAVAVAVLHPIVEAAAPKPDTLIN